MFTQDNTTGYSDTELAALNAGLRRRLSTIGADDVEARQEAEKAFHDEMSGYEIARDAFNAAKARKAAAPRNGFAASPALKAAIADYNECLDRMIESEQALS